MGRQPEPWSTLPPALAQRHHSQLPALAPSPPVAGSLTAGYGGAYSGYYGNSGYDYYGSASGHAGQGGAATAAATAAAATADTAAVAATSNAAAVAATATASGDAATQAAATEPAAAAAAAGEGKEAAVEASGAHVDAPAAAPEPPVIVQVPLKQTDAPADAEAATEATEASGEAPAEPASAPTAEELERTIRAKLAAAGIATSNGSGADEAAQEQSLGQQKQVGWGAGDARHSSVGSEVELVLE